MPKTPILYREGLYEVLRDGTIHDLDWNIVNTSLGAMMEPRQSLGIHAGATLDPYDVSYNKRSEFSQDRLLSTFNIQGRQIPRNYNL